MRSEVGILLVLASLILFAIGSYIGLVILPPSPEKILENNYRIIFFHLPAAINSFLAFTVTLISGILYLKTRDSKFDILASSSALVGFVYITAALISGSIWANRAWGTYWNWDPRETTVLILWFVYAAYFALRSSIDNPEDKARISSIYAIFAYVTVPLSYLSTRLWFSLHPTTAEIHIKIAVPLMLNFAAFTLLYIALTYINYKAEKIMEVV